MPPKQIKITDNANIFRIYSGPRHHNPGLRIKPGTVLDVPFGEFPSSAFKTGKGKCLKVRQSKKLTSALMQQYLGWYQSLVAP